MEEEKNVIEEVKHLDTVLKYAPSVVVILAIIFQYNLFVTPEKLEIKHREIMKDVAQTYTTKEQYNDLKTQLADMQKKIDKMYDILTSKRGL